MDARLFIAILIPAIILIPALILFLLKKKMIKKALIKYQQYEDGEIEPEEELITDDIDVLEMDTRGKYHHVSYDSIEEAEKAFNNRYTWIIRILFLAGVAAFMFLYHSYLDFKENLIVEGDTVGSFGLAEGSDIPRSRFEFEVKEGQRSADLVISFSDYIEWEYEANIYVQIFDPIDSLIVFEMDKVIVPSVDGDDNIAFSTQDTTVYFSNPGKYIMDYYTMTTEIPAGHFYLKANE